MTGSLLVDRLGRRSLFIASNIGMLAGTFFSVVSGMRILTPPSRSVDFAAWTVTTALYNQLHLTSAAKGRSVLFLCSLLGSAHKNNLATIPFIFIYFLCYDIAYSPLLVVYTLEILPFNVRAKGFAVMVRYLAETCSGQKLSICGAEHRCFFDSRLQSVC